jgi:NADH-quinone oxidoreductase subunit J
MNIVFYVSSGVAVVATAAAISGLNAVHSLLYLIVSLLAVALVFFTLGAPVVAALEVIIYAGAIMVLFLFVVMILNLGSQSVEQERRWLTPRAWVGPAVLAAVLVGEVIWVVTGSSANGAGTGAVQPADLGAALFGPYLLGVELASLILLSGLVGAYHLGRRIGPEDMDPPEPAGSSSSGTGEAKTP